VIKKKALIAIVDDDESVCRAMERLVRSLGMMADTYLSGGHFLEQMESTPGCLPDCVILDVQMPGLDGVEVQQRLRRTYPDIPVFFITAHDDRVARDQATAGGAVAVLRKPCNDALIMRTLQTALGLGRSRGLLDQGPMAPPKAD
jgi:FixJ family two-component response regulator